MKTRTFELPFAWSLSPLKTRRVLFYYYNCLYILLSLILFCKKLFFLRQGVFRPIFSNFNVFFRIYCLCDYFGKTDTHKSSTLKKLKHLSECRFILFKYPTWHILEFDFCDFNVDARIEIAFWTVYLVNFFVGLWIIKYCLNWPYLLFHNVKDHTESDEISKVEAICIFVLTNFSTVFNCSQKLWTPSKIII
jgi:hypothetical protein